MSEEYNIEEKIPIVPELTNTQYKILYSLKIFPEKQSFYRLVETAGISSSCFNDFKELYKNNYLTTVKGVNELLGNLAVELTEKGTSLINIVENKKTHKLKANSIKNIILQRYFRGI